MTDVDVSRLPGGTLCVRYVRTLFVTLTNSTHLPAGVSAAVNSGFSLPPRCRHREDLRDRHRGAGVLADLHGLVHHQQHQTGEEGFSIPLSHRWRGASTSFGFFYCP